MSLCSKSILSAISALSRLIKKLCFCQNISLSFKKFKYIFVELYIAADLEYYPFQQSI